MATQRWNLRMAVVAVCLCLLGLLPQTSADYVLTYCSDINTSGLAANFSEWQTLGLCHDFCLPKDYAFAVVQYQNCWCSDYAPGGDNSTCSTPCPGYPSEICGDSGGKLYGYLQLNVKPSGTGVTGGSAPSTTAAPVTVTVTSSSSTSDDPSSSSVETSSSSTPSESPTSTSMTVTPIVSTFTTVGQVHTVTITPTSPANSLDGLGQKNSSGGLGTGGAVGLTIGLVALIAIVSALIWFYFRRKRQQEAEEYASASRRGSSAGLGGPVPSRTMSENSRYVLGTDGRQVVETWEPGDTPGSRRSRLIPVDPRLDPFAPLYQRNGDSKSRESFNTLRDDHDYSRRVVHQGPILRATNPDHNDD